MLEDTSIPNAPKSLLLIVMWTVIVLVVVAVGLKGFFVLEHEYICEPKVQAAIRTFISEVRVATHENFSDRPAFLSKEDFQEFKNSTTTPYSLSIKDWTLGDIAHSLLKFEGQPPYGVTVAPEGEHAIICLGKEYKVLTVRR
jgi:hypothetical protein